MTCKSVCTAPLGMSLLAALNPPPITGNAVHDAFWRSIYRALEGRDDGQTDVGELLEGILSPAPAISQINAQLEALAQQLNDVQPQKAVDLSELEQAIAEINTGLSKLNEKQISIELRLAELEQLHYGA